MTERFDRFTPNARRAFEEANVEALRFNHNYVGTEHLLLGLLAEGDGRVAKALASLEVTPDKIRTGIEFIIGRGDRTILGKIGLTPRAKKVIELAVDEVRLRGSEFLGTEHVLVALAREGEGIAAGVLAANGISLDGLRQVFWPQMSSVVSDFGQGQLSVKSITADGSIAGLYLNGDLQLVLRLDGIKELQRLFVEYLGKSE